jgi:hypothetical protein
MKNKSRRLRHRSPRKVVERIRRKERTIRSDFNI